MNKRRLNHLLLLNQLELIDMNWRDSSRFDVIWISVIKKYRCFAQLFNFKIILALSVFENAVFSRVSLSVFDEPCHNMLLLKKFNITLLNRPKITMFLVGIPSPLLHPNPIPSTLFIMVIYELMLPMVLDGFTPMPSFMFLTKWITFVTTIPTPKGDVATTLSPSINGSTRLVRTNECVVQTHSTYCNIFRPYSYRRQRDMLHPCVVGACRFIFHWFLSSIFLKHVIKWWCWYIVDIIFVRFIDVRRKYIIFIACNCLLFACDLFNLIVSGFFFFARNMFNFIDRSLFNYFARVFLITLISLIFVVRIYLTISLIPTFYPCIITLAPLTVISMLMFAVSSTSAVRFS